MTLADLLPAPRDDMAAKSVERPIGPETLLKLQTFERDKVAEFRVMAASELERRADGIFLKSKADHLSTFASYVDLGVEDGCLVTVCLVAKEGGAVCGKMNMRNTVDHLVRHSKLPLTHDLFLKLGEQDTAGNKRDRARAHTRPGAPARRRRRTTRLWTSSRCTDCPRTTAYCQDVLPPPLTGARRAGRLPPTASSYRYRRGARHGYCQPRYAPCQPAYRHCEEGRGGGLAVAVMAVTGPAVKGPAALEREEGVGRIRVNRLKSKNTPPLGTLHPRLRSTAG